jgi:uncharacterized protein YeaO (DUF488 family)
VSVGIVRLGTERQPGEGVRLGTVRHPPRGVRKEHYASGNWFDLWLPELAPSADLLRRARTPDGGLDWPAFARRYRVEMAAPEASRLLDLLAAMSRQAAFSVGCYCEDETRCHRSLLRALLADRGAVMRSP